MPVVGIDEARSDHMALGVDDFLAVVAFFVTTAIFPFLIPTLRTASSPLSGSMTRPFRITRSYSFA